VPIVVGEDVVDLVDRDRILTVDAVAAALVANVRGPGVVVSAPAAAS